MPGYGRYTPTLSGATKSRVLTCDPALFPHIGDAITMLAESYMWVEVGDSVANVIDAVWDAINSFYGDAMIGEIDIFLKALPLGWLALDGTTYDASDYPQLYAVIDANYRDEINEQFTLPDFDGRFIVDMGSTYNLGDVGGSASHALTVDELPAHTHTYTPPVANIDLESPGAPDILAAGLGTPIQTGSTGNGSAHENRPPYIAVRFGIFAG